MKIALIVLALACSALPVFSQTPAPAAPAPVLPAGPLLHSVPNMSQWEIVFTYPADAAKKKRKPNRKDKSTPTAPNPLPSKIVTTKTGRIVHEQQTDVRNQTTDVWYDGGTQYTKSIKDSAWYQSGKMAAGASDDVPYHPLPASGYRDMELVKAENYVGTITYDGRKCLVFTPEDLPKPDLSNEAAAKKKLEAMDEVAYVEADTRLPVAVQAPENLRVFHFDPPPAQMQSLPDDLREQIKKGEDGRAQLDKPATRPY